MNKFTKSLSSVGATAMALAMPVVTFAQNNPFKNSLNQVNEVSGKAGLGQARSLPEIVGSIINVVLGFMGILLLFYLLYAGFLWMTSSGDSKQVDKAKAMIRDSIIGLIIVVAAFSISNFVLNSLINVAGT